MKKAIIYTDSIIVKKLIEHELLGQFSDGRWSNSRNKSWKYLDKVKLSNEKIGVYFNEPIWGYKGWNCNDSQLKRHIGTRLWVIGIVSNYFKNNIPEKDLDDIIEIFTEIDDCEPLPRSKKAKYEAKDINIAIERYKGYSKKAGDFFDEKVKKFEEIVKKYKKDLSKVIETSKYSRTDLVEDLKKCTEALIKLKGQKMLKEIIEKVKKGLKLIDHDGNELTSIVFHGDELEVIEVLSDSLIVMLPDGTEEEVHIGEVISQDDNVKGIK
jgi:hypothetical protein